MGIQSSGLMQILQLKRRNMKRSARRSRVLQCRFFRRWLVQQEACQELVVCLIWEACLIWVVWVELHRQQIHPVDPQSKRSIKSHGSMYSLHSLERGINKAKT